MMNSQTGSHKVSDVEKTMNLFTIYIVTALTILTLVLAILGGFWHAEASQINEELKNLSMHTYIDLGQDQLKEGFYTFVRYFQLLSLLLPTSLFVSFEVLKVFIAYFIVNDWRLYSKKRGKITNVKNMSIIEDLGMI